MSDTRRRWPLSAAAPIPREFAQFDFYSVPEDDDADADAAAAYDCGFDVGCAVDDGEDSGYTEIPMLCGEAGLRDRIARLVFRPSKQPALQQQQQQPPPPPPPLPPQVMPLQSRHRPAGGGGAFPGYAYTRWECLPAAAAAPPPASATPPASKSARAAPPPSGCGGVAGGSQRTVRFHCPRDSSAAADGDRWAAVQPYSTFVSTVAGSVPTTRLGERSASSGYGSDVDIGFGCGGSDGDDFYAVREEDIDRLLLGDSPSTARQKQQQQQQQPQPELGSIDTDVDVQTLDLAAYFPPTDSSKNFFDSSSKIDRIVSDMVRIKSAALLAGRDSPGRLRLGKLGKEESAAKFELSELRSASSVRSNESKSQLCYYQ